MKDLIILGNGMAGMTAALYAKRASLDFKIVGKDEYDFGQIGNAILVENYPCAGSVSGFDLAMKLHEQLEENEIKVEEHEIEYIDIDFTLNDKLESPIYYYYFNIYYADGSVDKAKTIIYALGATPRQLNCKIEDEIPIHYCALCDGSFYKDKTVAVIGGGDSAFTQAEYLSKICKKVNIIMCDENITAADTIAKRVKQIPNVFIIENYPIDRIYKLEDGIHLFSEKVCGKDNFYSNYTIKTDGVFVAIGMMPNSNPLFDFDIIDSNGYIIADENGITAFTGLFCAGDIRQKRMRQSITAAADGANAVQSVIDYLKNY